MTKELREEIYELKENFYSANIEKRKVNEKLFSLKESQKKVDRVYKYEKEIADKVDQIKNVKDVLKFKKLSFKPKSINSISVKANKKNLGLVYKSDENSQNKNVEFVAKIELKEAYNKTSFNDRLVIDYTKDYLLEDTKDKYLASTLNTGITLFAPLYDKNQEEINNSYINNMLVAYQSYNKLKESHLGDKTNNIAVIEMAKGSHLIPLADSNGEYCALVGGNVEVAYKEKINTGDEVLYITHLKIKK